MPKQKPAQRARQPARTLHLTSPMLEGPDVRHFQELAGHNPYGDFFDDELDGRFGPMCAIAARRSRFWLGYPERGANTWRNGVAGPLLIARLEGRLELPGDYAKRRAARIKAKPKTPLREKALKALTAKLGQNEHPPGSNICFASKWYGLIGPWCAMAVTWSYETGGPSEAFDKHAARWAYVPFMVADARQGRHYLTVVRNPQPGDIVCYRFGSSEWKHVGLFEHWLSGSSVFSAIEGNTSQSSDDNGGEVQRRERLVASGVVFIHVGR